jgi:hypothetical protein
MHVHRGFVRTTGAMAGVLVAFALFRAMSDALGLTPLGGPEYNPKDDEEGGGAQGSSLIVCE